MFLCKPQQASLHSILYLQSVRFSLLSCQKYFKQKCCPNFQWISNFKFQRQSLQIFNVLLLQSCFSLPRIITQLWGQKCIFELCMFTGSEGNQIVQDPILSLFKPEKQSLKVNLWTLLETGINYSEEKLYSTIQPPVSTLIKTVLPINLWSLCW